METENFQIWTPDNSDQYALVQDLARIADDVDEALVMASPAGVVSSFAGASAPSGWLLCSGQAVSRTAYSRLFAAIGTLYGAGDNATTFNLPNLRGRVPVGLDSTQAEFNTLAGAGGAKTHTLTGAEIPNHFHQVVGGANGTTRLYSARASLNNAPGDPANAAWFGTGYNGVDNVVTSRVGSDHPHNNLQPYLVLNYIIKT